MSSEAIDLRVGSWNYRWPAHAAGMWAKVRALLADEEQRALRLLPMLDQTPEHLLVHQVRMYMLRFAVPAVEIESGGIAHLDVVRVRQRLWTCMFGRALDDIVDGDSRFFTPAASCVLLLHYARLLGLESAWVSDECVSAATRPSRSAHKDSGEVPTFACVRQDVGLRVAYYLKPADIHGSGARQALADYVGLLLGAADLADALADKGRASTLLSRHLHMSLEDDEGKVILGVALIKWYVGVAEMLSTAAQDVSLALRDRGAGYSAAIVDGQRGALMEAIGVLASRGRPHG